MSGVTPEERQAAAIAIRGTSRLTYWSKREGRKSDVEAESEVIDALIRVGWRPGGAPVVDREALARRIASEVAVIGGRSYYKAVSDGIAAASGLFVDRVTVENESIGKALDHLADAGVNLNPGDLRAFAAAYREGKR